MKYLEKTDAIIALQDGSVFYGKSIGFKGTAVGEACYNTGMTGYQEIFSDPSYFGQLMIMTNVHIGNYGTLEREMESDKIQITGLICRDFNQHNSRVQSEGDLESFFEKHRIVTVTDVDTRALVSHIRQNGAMNIAISNDGSSPEELMSLVQSHPDMSGRNLAQEVSTKEPYSLGSQSADIRIAVMDYGVKHSILRNLEERGAFLKVFPHTATLKDIMEFKPDGIFLSNGPGDPSAMNSEIDTVSDIVDSGLPVFGICLGHQLISLSQGLSSYKMHNGHRGINHGVLNLETKRAEVTSQNHGFAIDYESIEKSTDCILTHSNLNDNTVEGMRIKGKSVFSVQFHPEASPGPNDSKYLFDQFFDNIKQSAATTA